MYDQYYGLQGRPFQLTPDPHFYFESSTHRKAMSYLGYGLAQGEGFIVITGDIGAGKTTLVGHLMATVDPARLTAVKIVSTQVEGDDMLRLTAQAFGIGTEDSPKALLLQRIEAWLHAQARAGRRTLLIVDEAQNLPVSALEELRMLSNFQLGGQALLQIFLLGQPEFRDMVARAPELEQLRQRVIATHHLEPMLASETQPYIIHRLKLVGWDDNPRFTADAFAAMHQASGGVPRRLNALASRVLLLGAIDRLDMIDATVVQVVVADMSRDADAGTPAAPASAPIEPSIEPDITEAIAAAIEPPVVLPEPIPASTPVVAPGLSASDLHAIKAEIAEVRDALLAFAEHDGRAALVAKVDIIDKRLSMIEGKSNEQDAALRRVLTLLVDWVERDEHQVERLRA